MATTTARSQSERARPGSWADIGLFAALVWGLSPLFVLIVRGVVDFAALEQTPGWAWAFLIVGGWTPAIAALGTQVLRTGSPRGVVVGWRWPALRWLLIALALPCVYTTTVASLTWLTGAGTLDLATFTRAATDALGSGWAPPEVIALCYGALTFVAGTLALSLFSLGEEIGWCGFLIPRLVPLLGVPRTALVTGVLWSSYHFPLMLLAKNYTQGTAVWFAMLGLTITLIGVAFLTTWLWLRSGSIWPTVLLHACHNVLIFYLFEPLTRAQPLTPYIGGEHGLGMMLVAALAALLVTRMAGKLPR
jgi:membrane protease YdiL (CAAX protease family)